MLYALAEDPNWTDIVSAIGQAAGAIFTAVAVAVALWIAIRDARQRTNEEHAKCRAQAKLVLIDHESFDQHYIPKGQKSEGNYFAISVLNIGQRPILDVTAETLVFEPARRTYLSEPKRFIDPSYHDTYQALTVEMGFVEKIHKWRVFWQDADGLEWQVTSQKREVHPKAKSLEFANNVQYLYPLEVHVHYDKDATAPEHRKDEDGNSEPG